MRRDLYGTYRGRKSLLQRILTAVAVILAVALLLALVALFVLPNYMTYTGDGLRFELPLPHRGQSQDGQGSQGGDGEPDFVIDDQSAPSGQAPSAAPSAAAKIDLSGLVRRDPPRGLVAAAGAGPRAGDGSIFDMTGELMAGNGDLNADPTAARELNLSLPYAAAWLAPDWSAALAQEGFADDLTRRCLALADSGYDEILLSEAVPQDDGTALAALYRQVKKALADAGWQGRLGLVLDQSLAGSGYAEELMGAIAQSFDRLYFRRAMQANVKSALEGNGFAGTTADYVTVYATIPSVNWSWAVLP